MQKNNLILIILFIVAFTVVGYFGVRAVIHSKSTEPPKYIITPPAVSIDDPVLGPENAPVTIIEFSDFQCPFCKSMRDTLAEVTELYPGQVRLVWKDYPDTDSHREAIPAAHAARCAQKQDMFWEYHDYLFANQNLLSSALYAQIAQTLELDLDLFQQCLLAPRDPAIDRGFQEGIDRGVSATPHFFVNTYQKSGTMSSTELQIVINQIIDEASE
ncbi:DsbA family protein [Patescibacteria group bacterium]